MQHRDDIGTKKLPRLMLAAPASGSGKTLVTCGLLQALVNRKIKTAAFKCGPDYIDPMFHSRVIGVPSRNLDTFFTDVQTTRWLFGRQARKAELSVMEGVMGFYDGVAGITTKASSWELARVTETPVILVVNARGMSLSVVPLIEGFLHVPERKTGCRSVDLDKKEGKNSQSEDAADIGDGNVLPEINAGYMDSHPGDFYGNSMIRGVILNQASASMYPDLKREIESRLPVHVLGYVPRVDDCVIESRHLGLVTPDEIAGLKEKLQKLADILEETLDIDGIIQLAQTAPVLDISMPERLQNFFQAHGSQIFLDQPFCDGNLSDNRQSHEQKNLAANGKNLVGLEEFFRVTNKSIWRQSVRIAVARDEAFCFYYADNLELLRALGADLVYFSPLHDMALPEDIQGLFLGGGYPELYARALSENRLMLNSVRSRIQRGLPFLAECGGFLYLHESMEDMDGKAYPMAGIFPARAYKTERLNRFGYVTLTPNVSQRSAGAEVGKFYQVCSKTAMNVRTDPGAEVDKCHETSSGAIAVGEKNKLHNQSVTSCPSAELGFLALGEEIRAHEFHYFDSTENGAAFHAQKPCRKRSWDCMLAGENFAAGFPHLYYYSNPEFAARFVEACAKNRNS